MPTPILYAPSGQPVAFELSGDEKRTELLLTSFGLLSGIMAKSGELTALAERHGVIEAVFVQIVATEILKLLGDATVQERFGGLKIQHAPSPGAELKKAAEEEVPTPGPRLVGPPDLSD